MVLQQNHSVAIWGWDNPKTSIELCSSWGEKIVTKTDLSGYWKTKLIKLLLKHKP